MEGSVHSLEKFDEIFTNYGNLNILEEDPRRLYTVPYILQSISELFEFNGIPVQEDSSITDRKCIRAFKYLLLNTDFKCRMNLAKDPENGYLVTIDISRWRTHLSRPFLIKILCHLGYEQILAESLLHMPLDLCIEILETVKTNIFLLDFGRRLDLVTAIISNCYKNLIVAWKVGVQTVNFEEKCERLMIVFQNYMSFLSSPNFLRLNEVKGLQQSERIGIILKKLIVLLYKCLRNNEDDSLPPEIGKHYKIVFGNDPLQRSEADFGPYLRMLNQELKHILMQKLKALSFACFNDWAYIEADGNPSVSMQVSILNDFYHLIEFLKVHRCFLHPEHLTGLMESYNPQPLNIVSTLNYDGLRYGSIEIKMSSIKSVINHYSEWDHNAFDLIQSNRRLLDSDDLPYLIDYLVLIMPKPGQEDHKTRVSVAIRKVLYQQRVRETGYTERAFPWNILENDQHECVDPAYSADRFKTFIANNPNLKSSQNLRTTLSFLLNNPREVFEVLMKVVIGVSDYAEISIPPEDLTFFHPVIKFANSHEDFMLCTMKNVITNIDKWDPKKFADLVNHMLDEFMITANDFLDSVFSYWLRKEPTNYLLFISMLKLVQNCIAKKCTQELKKKTLYSALTLRLADCRTNILMPRTVSDKLGIEIDRTARLFFRVLRDFPKVQYIEHELEPIDRYISTFTDSSWTGRSDGGSDLPYILDRLASAVLNAINRVRFGGMNVPDVPANRSRLNHLKNYFARYALIKFSESEIITFATALAYDRWNHFNYANPFAAFEDMVNLVIDTAMYFLELPALHPPESFPCVMRALAKFSREFSFRHVDEYNTRVQSDVQNDEPANILRDMYAGYKSLRDKLLDLQECMRYSTFCPLYDSLLDTLIDPSLDNYPRGVALYKIQIALEKFGNDCLLIPHSEVTFAREPSAKVLSFKETNDFIHDCLEIDHAVNAFQYDSLSATFERLCRLDYFLN